MCSSDLRAVAVDAKSVRIDDGSVLEADYVITALSERQTCRLNGQEEPPAMGVSTFYYSVPKPLFKGRRILLNGNAGSILNHVHFPTSISPDLSSKGTTLMSVSALGLKSYDQATGSRLDTELCQIFDLPKPCWTMIHRCQIDDALPKTQLAGRFPPKKNGPIAIGDWLTTGSIQGALECGQQILEWIEPA